MKKNSHKVIKQSKKKFFRIMFGRSAVVVLLLVLQFFLIFAVFAGVERRLTVAYSGISAIALVMAIYIAATTDNPAVKLSWTALMIFTPVFGSLLYIFIHADLGHRIMNRKLTKVLSSTEEYSLQEEATAQKVQNTDKWLYNLSRYTYSFGHFPIYDSHNCKYYPLGEDMLEDLKTDLENARDFIFLEFFIIEESCMWDGILEILKKKAASGVEVRVMYDGTGSVSLLPFNYPKKLEEVGIHCKVFSPLTPFVSTHYNNRDHRKIIVIDGKKAYTGGINLADEYINKKNRFGHWKDTAVRLDGPCVDSFTLMFLQMWNVSELKDSIPSYLGKCNDDSAKASDGFVIPYGDSPLDNERVGENVYMEIINTAKDYLYIMTPYLIIDGEMTAALQNAAKRGVDVRIVLPETPDHKIAYAIAKSHFYELVPCGVKLYTYTPGFIHAKVMLSDGIKAVVGTINLDYRSLYLHFECAAFIYASGVIKDIEADFDRTFEKSRCLTNADLKKRGPFSMLYSGILKLIAPLM